MIDLPPKLLKCTSLIEWDLHIECVNACIGNWNNNKMNTKVNDLVKFHFAILDRKPVWNILVCVHRCDSFSKAMKTTTKKTEINSDIWICHKHSEVAQLQASEVTVRWSSPNTFHSRWWMRFVFRAERQPRQNNSQKSKNPPHTHTKYQAEQLSVCPVE